MASARVFSLPELAEDIILRLRLGDILQLQRTCRVLRHMIDDTSTIQQLLFLKPTCDAGLCQLDRRREPGLRPTVESLNSPQSQWASPAAHDSERHPIENPFLVLFDRDSGVLADPRFHHPEASWRRMLITQPPVTGIDMTHRHSLHPHDYIPLAPAPTPPSLTSAPTPPEPPPAPPRDGGSSRRGAVAAAPQPYVTLGDLDRGRGPSVWCIRSWCLWKPFEDWHQLRCLARTAPDRFAEAFLEFEFADEVEMAFWIERRRFEALLRH